MKLGKKKSKAINDAELAGVVRDWIVGEMATKKIIEDTKALVSIIENEMNKRKIDEIAFRFGSTVFRIYQDYSRNDGLFLTYKELPIIE